MSAPPNPQLIAANRLIGEGNLEEARALLLRSVQASGPRVHPHILYQLAAIADVLGQPDQADHYFERAAAAAPHDPQIAVAHASSLSDRARPEDAARILQSFAAHPPNPNIAARLVGVLSELEQNDEALLVAQAAHVAFPDHPVLAIAHGAILNKLGRPDDALAVYRQAHRTTREGALLFNIGRPDEGIARLRAAAEMHPDDESAWIQYAFFLNYSDSAPAAEQLRAHRQIGRTLRARVGQPFTAWNVSKDPNRPLRIGVLSPDLRRHAVVSFLAPLLENYDKTSWHITAYSTTRQRDDVTARLRALVDSWRDIPYPHPRYLANLIRKDRIDVLIELSGLTENSAIAAVHLRPAPVQVTYLGYPNTTGLDTIDIRVVDSITDPPGSEHLAVEHLSRIDPCFLCYKPIIDAPELVPPPSATGAPIAFGSFNLPIKMSPHTLALWSRVLNESPSSTLILKHVVLTQEWMRVDVVRRLAAAGIDESRVTVLSPMPSYSDHLAAYAKVDIALDTFPYHGTTTTCEAMWMGVPVITLTGDRHASRVGTSLLSAVGLPDLAANSEDDFVRIASTLAHSSDRLRDWRTPGPTSLRSIMAASPLCDAKAFCSRFQAAIRQGWQSWCQTKT